VHVGSSGWLRLSGTNSKFVLYFFLLLMKNVLRHGREKYFRVITIPFFLLNVKRQITENGGIRKLRQLRCFGRVKRALQMHPKPTTSQPQRSRCNAILSLCSEQVLISRVIVLQHSVVPPSTALLYGPKEGGNVQKEMSNTC